MPGLWEGLVSARPSSATMFVVCAPLVSAEIVAKIRSREQGVLSFVLVSYGILCLPLPSSFVYSAVGFVRRSPRRFEGP